jgi:hypothetical protein
MRLVLFLITVTVATSQYNATTLWTCDPTSTEQIWGVDTTEPFPFAHIYLAKTLNPSNNIALVMDIEAWSNSTGSTVWLYPNQTGFGGYNEQWTFSGNGAIISKMNGLCLAATDAIAGSIVTMQNCDQSALQTWAFAEASGAISNAGAPGLCLYAGKLPGELREMGYSPLFR